MIRHSLESPSSRGRNSQSRRGTIIGRQFSVAALMTSCSTRSRLSDSMPCRNTVITDAQHDGSAVGVGHARKYLGKLGRGTRPVTTELHPVAPESYLLQLQSGVLPSTN